MGIADSQGHGGVFTMTIEEVAKPLFVSRTQIRHLFERGELVEVISHNS